MDVVLGDARLSLEREASRGDYGNFDFLVVDAYSDDSVPVHLLTREAFELYLRHLRSDGVLAVHITCQRLDLSPVVTALSRYFGLTMIVIHGDKDQQGALASDWVLLSFTPASVLTDDIVQHGYYVPYKIRALLWTDDYSNLWQIVTMKTP